MTRSPMTAAGFRRALRTLGWSQAEAAERLAVSAGQPRISDYATGKRPVPPYIAAALRTHIELEDCRRQLED